MLLMCSDMRDTNLLVAARCSFWTDVSLGAMRPQLCEAEPGRQSDFGPSGRTVSPGWKFEMEAAEASAVVSGAIESNLSE